MMKKLLIFIFAMSVVISTVACGKDNTPEISTPSNPPSWVEDSNNEDVTNSNISNEIEYVGLTDFYDITFKGISPYVSIEFTPKVFHLPLWDGIKGNNSKQRQVQFLIEGEQYEEKAKADGSSYWELNPDTKLNGNLKNGDTITLLPDKYTTNYDIAGNGSLELGTYLDEANGQEITYILKDNVITITGADEYVYKPDMVTDEMIEFFGGDFNILKAYHKADGIYFDLVLFVEYVEIWNGSAFLFIDNPIISSDGKFRATGNSFDNEYNSYTQPNTIENFEENIIKSNKNENIVWTEITLPLLN